MFSLLVQESLKENNADTANSKQSSSSNASNSSVNDKKLNSKTLSSNDLTATAPASANEEIATNKEREFMSNAILASNEEQIIANKKLKDINEKVEYSLKLYVKCYVDNKESSNFNMCCEHI